jgi:hypothetical protein
MSTIPLSAKNIPPEGTREYGPMAPEDRVDAGSNARLDSVIDKALEHMPDDDAVPTPKAKRKDLDTLISEGLDRHEAAVEDKEAWTRSKDARAELNQRYASQGADDAKTLKTFLHVADQLKKDPTSTAVALAESYMKASRYNLLKDTAQKPKPEARFVDGKRYNGEVLDSIIENAMETAGTEREMYEATKEDRARLKALWPDLSFDQAMERLRQVDRRLHDDPIGGSAELAAAFGMPVLPHQQQADAERVQAAAEVAHAQRQLAHLDQVRHRMAHIIQSDPRFAEAERQGATQQQILGAAYEIALHEHNEVVKADNWTRSQLDLIAKESEPLAMEIVHVLSPGNPGYVKHIAEIADASARLHAAAGVAVHRVNENAAAIAKARKVKATKSSSGANPRGAGGKDGLDAAIEKAMAGKF